jgi:hypothetical protein
MYALVCMYTYIHTRTHVHTHAQAARYTTHAYVCTYVPTCVCMYACIPVCTHTHTHILSLRALKHLTSLDVSGCNTLNNTGLQAIAHGCNKLQQINLKSCTGVTNHAHLAQCNCLTQLTLASCPSDEMSKSLHAVCQAHMLRSLDLSKCCTLVDDDLIQVALSCSALTSVSAFMYVCMYVCIRMYTFG